eukprot:GGOE01004811.1.p1 GENE.GGOE01004811.1~~GGOE01004811.1.p1  ORF type:complete len:753 (-),score=222.34 GGOE01004811.1:414-2618(-)
MSDLEIAEDPDGAALEGVEGVGDAQGDAREVLVEPEEPLSRSEMEGRRKELTRLAQTEAIMKCWRLQAAVKARMERLLEHATLKLKEKEDEETVFDLSEDYIQDLDAKVKAIQRGLQIHLNVTSTALNNDIVKEALKENAFDDMGNLPRVLEAEFRECIDDPELLELIMRWTDSYDELETLRRGLRTPTPKPDVALTLSPETFEAGFVETEEEVPMLEDELLQRIEYQSQMVDKAYANAVAGLVGAQAKFRHFEANELGQLLARVLQAVASSPLHRGGNGEEAKPPAPAWQYPDPKDDMALDEWIDARLSELRGEQQDDDPHRTARTESSVRSVVSYNQRVVRLMDLVQAMKHDMDAQAERIGDLEDELQHARQLSTLAVPCKPPELTNEIAKGIRMQMRCQTLEQGLKEANERVASQQRELQAAEKCLAASEAAVAALTRELEGARAELNALKRPKVDEVALAEERLVRSQWQDVVERFATSAAVKFNRTLPDFAVLLRDLVDEELHVVPTSELPNVKLERELRGIVESTVASIVQSLDYLEDLLRHTKWGAQLRQAVDAQMAAVLLAVEPAGPSRRYITLPRAPMEGPELGDCTRQLLPYFRLATQDALLAATRGGGSIPVCFGAGCPPLPIAQLKLVLSALRGFTTKGRSAPAGAPATRLLLPPVVRPQAVSAASASVPHRVHPLSVQTLLEFEETARQNARSRQVGHLEQSDPLAPRKGPKAKEGFRLCA